MKISIRYFTGYGARWKEHLGLNCCGLERDSLTAGSATNKLTNSPSVHMTYLKRKITKRIFRSAQLWIKCIAPLSPSQINTTFEVNCYINNVLLGGLDPVLRITDPVPSGQVQVPVKTPRCWVNRGPHSKTVGHKWPNSGLMFRARWVRVDVLFYLSAMGDCTASHRRQRF